MKKFLSALLAVAILMSMALPVMATENTTEAEILNEEIVTTLTEETVEEQAETEPSLTEATEEVTDAASNDVATVGDDFVFDFDDLLFVGGDIKELTANSVSYYENETPVKPVVTVYYKDGTSGALPDSISVTYPAMPTQPGVYDLELTVASKYAVPFQVTVLPLVPVGPSAKLNAPVIALDYSAFGEDTITWETVEHADKYEIYRATSKTGTFKKIDETEELVWVSETIPVGKTYYYKVVAVYAEDIELNSDESNMVAIDGRCARPELTISVATSGKPALSWKKVTSAKKYEIYRYSADEDVKKVTTTTKTSYTDTSAKSGKTYVYFIIALGSKSAYNSPYSNLVEQMCFLETPQLTVKVDAATGKPLLSWKKIPGAAYYIIGRLLPDGNPEMLDLDNYEFMSLEEEDSRSFLDVSAEPGKEYSYAIGGVNATLTEASYVSELKTVKCTFARPSVDVVVNDNGRPVITWEAVEGADSYIVYRSTKSNKSYKEVKTVTEPSYVDEAASAGTTYYYKVVAVAGETKSAESSYVKATGKCATPELTVSAGSTGKPVLTWNKISGAKKYEIWRSVDGAAFKKLTTVTKTTYTDSKATEGAECTYKVKALGSKSSYNGNFSEVAGCKVTCAAPSLTAKVDTATGKPSLSWSKVTGANGYAIYRSENGGEFALLTTVTGTSYKDEAVAVDNKYSYYVVTVGKSEAFNSIASATKTVEVAVGQPQVKGTVNENGKPVITWDAVEDAVAYKVYRSTKSNKSYKEIATVAELTYVDTSVSTGKTYYYKVVAVGANSSSPESAYVKITGKCAQPVAEATLNAKSGKPVITWEKVSGAKKYEVYRATSVDGKYSKIGTATKTTYTDSKASVGTAYYYKVVAAGSKSAYNSLQSAPTEGVTALMAQPSVKLSNDSKTGKPVVSWGKVSGASQYVVMYVDITDFMESVEGPDETYVEENMQYVTTTKTSVTLTETEAGHIYLVTMVAVPKNEAYCSVPTDPQYVASNCQAVKITGFIDEDYGKPGAYWNEVDGAEAYAVYRSTKKGSGYKFLGYVEGDYFIDGSAAKGKTYYYKVTAVTYYTESAMSNYVKLKSKK